MSGVKTATVQYIPTPTPAEEAARRRDLEERDRAAKRARQEAESLRQAEAARLAALEAERQRRTEALRQHRAEVALAQREAGSLRRGIEAADADASRLQRQLALGRTRLDELTRDAMHDNERLVQMRAETTEAIKEAKKALKDAADRAGLLRQELAAVEEALDCAGQSSRAAEEALRELDGPQIRQARAAVAEAEQFLAREQALHDLVQAEILAWAASPVQGRLMADLLDASRAQGYTPTRVIEDESGVAVIFQDAERRTLTAAIRIRDEGLAERATREAEGLEIVIKGKDQPSADACVLSAVAILEELRQRGIATSLRVAPAPGQRARTRGRTAIPERER